MTAKPDMQPPVAAPADTAARVVSVDEIAADTRVFRLSADAPLTHRAGQYALLKAEGFQPREYSIASTPESGYLEFHIKATGRGGLSDHIFRHWQEGSNVAVAMPFGDHYWRASPRPLLAIAGGVGIAPVKAIVEAQLAYAPEGEAHLYWGVRDRTHLYLDAHFRALAEAHKGFGFVPLLAQAEEGAALRTGYAGPAVVADFPKLGGYNIYLAGPRAMIDATLPLLLENGAEREYLFSDAFGP